MIYGNKRHIELSEKGVEFAAQKPLAEVLKTIIESDEHDLFIASILLGEGVFFSNWDEQSELAVEAMLKSDLFAQMDARDKHDVYATFKLFEEQNEQQAWRTEDRMAYEEGSLFPTHPITKRLGTRSVDAVLLSGAAAIDIYNAHSKLFASPEKSGFDSQLALTRFAGAALVVGLQNNQSRWGGVLGMDKPSFTIKDSPGIERAIYVGGDFHGDFRMAEVEHHKNGAYSPMGDFVEFAPSSDEVVIAAYDSSEPEIMEIILLHILQLSIPLDERQKLLTDAVNKVNTLLGSVKMVAGNFANFGSEDSERIAEQFKDTIIRGGKPRGTLRVVAGFDRLKDNRLEIRSDSDGVIFEQMYRDQGSGNEMKITQSVHFTTEQLPDLITAFVRQAAAGAGRTGVGTHLSLINVASDALH